MQKRTYEKLGLAAVILLAPGGFILGATLLANHYRKRHARSGASSSSSAGPASEAGEGAAIDGRDTLSSP